MPTIKEIQEKQSYIDKASQVEKKYGLPDRLLIGLLGQESNFNPRAVSKAGAQGIAQFMPLTSKEYGIDPFDPMQSIEAAGKYLNNSYKQLGNWDDTLRSYNMGLGGVKEWKAGRRRLPKETEEYIGKVYKKANINYTSTIDDSDTTDVTDFSGSDKMPNFAGVPDVYKEEEKGTVKDTEQTLEKLKEESFLQDVQDLYTQDRQQKEEQPQQGIPQQNVLETYQQVSDFIDNPIAQEGGKFTPIKDNRGQLAYPGRITQISSPNITMKGIPYDIIGVADTGETKILKPNQDYYFEGAKTVTEYPQITEKEKAFLKAVNIYKNKK